VKLLDANIEPQDEDVVAITAARLLHRYLHQPEKHAARSIHASANFAAQEFPNGMA
jgi:hypothetical protein